MSRRPMFRGKSVVITGGLGFIGSNLAIELVRQGARVTLVDNRDQGGGANDFNISPIKKQVSIGEFDVNDARRMRRAVADADYVFHLAARLSHVGSLADPIGDLAANAQGTLSVLEVCRKSGNPTCFVYAGTRAQYGRISRIPVGETDPMVPADPNGVSKIAGEAYARLYSELYGLRYVSLRLTNVYGPRQLLRHSQQGFLGWFFRQALENQTIRLFGDGTQKRDVIYVEDVIRALVLAATQKRAANQCYNIGSGTLLDLLTIAQIVIQVAGSGTWQLSPWPKGYAKTEIGTYLADTRKAHDELGWMPSVPFVEGVRRTVAYYRGCGDRYWGSD